MNKTINISDNQYKQIEDIISETWLSYYEIKKEDFILYNNEDDKIIAFGRIFNIWWKDYELSSLWVKKEYRGNNLWNEVINDLINYKFEQKNNLYLACKRELEEYYKKVSFNIIDKNIPEKLIWTLNWWKENNFDAIIMKYNK